MGGRLTDKAKPQLKVVNSEGQMGSRAGESGAGQGGPWSLSGALSHSLGGAVAPGPRDGVLPALCGHTCGPRLGEGMAQGPHILLVSLCRSLGPGVTVA